MKWRNPLNGEKDPMNWDAGWMQYQLAKKPFDLIQNVLLTIKSLFHHETEASFAPLKKVKFLANGPIDIPSLTTLIDEVSTEENIYEIEYIKLKKDKKEKSGKKNNIEQTTSEAAAAEENKLEVEPVDEFAEVNVLEEAIHDSVLEIETIELNEQKKEMDLAISPAAEDSTDTPEESTLELESLEVEAEEPAESKAEKAMVEEPIQEEAETKELTEELSQETPALVSQEETTSGINTSSSFVATGENVSPFTAWINNFSANHDPSYDKRSLASNVKQSVDSTEDIISESLAKILAKQGHIKESIDMYRKLSLKFPEKSSYFASRITELNK